MSATLRRPLWKNPVLVKEVRTRMRTSRAFVLLTVHLLVLMLVVAIGYLLFRSTLTSTSSLQDRRMFGKIMFGLLVWIEMILVCFTAPALTSGAIAAERERQTLDLLRVTLLPARSLVLGKYLSGLVFILLLLFTSLPLLSISYIIGGVLPSEIIIAALILFVTAIAFCALGIFCSSLSSRPLVATVVSYAFALLLVFGLPVIFLVMLFLMSSVGPGGSDLYTRLTPLALATVIFFGWLIVSITPLATIVASEVVLLNNQSIWWFSMPVNREATANIYMPSPWIPYLLIYLFLSLVLLWASVRLVRRID
jgi:ABC-2 type transport system permease protein